MSKYDFSLLEKRLEQFGIVLSTNQIAQFETYYELLIEWNEFMNLTAITEFEEVLIKHFLDSVSLCKAIDLSDKQYKVLDLGTGAGFPGIPLKIVFPDLKITLLDSLNKRIKFLNHVIDTIGLEHIEAIHGRAEDFAKQDCYRQQYDIVVSRAVANLSTLSEYCLPYVKMNGLFIPYKSENLQKNTIETKKGNLSEMEVAKKALSILGGEVVEQIEFYLPDTDIYRNLVMIRKVKDTNKKYPRKAGLPSKEPLCFT